MTRSHEINLHGKVVLVTGAASGVGLHAVKGFLAEGAKVVMVDKDDARLKLEVEGVWRVSGRDRLLALCCDVGDDGDLENLMPQVMGHWGAMDVLVNNASLCVAGPFEQQGARQIRAMVDVNLYGSLRLTQLVLPYMEKGGGGHILNVYSSSPFPLEADHVAYEASRAGVLVFTRALRRKYRNRNISFSLFCSVPSHPVLIADDLQAAHRGARLQYPGPEKIAAAMVDAVKRRSPRVAVSNRPLTHSITGFVDRAFPGVLDGLWSRRADKAFRELDAATGRKA